MTTPTPKAICLFLLNVPLVACTVRNPDVCCETEAECAKVRFDEVVPCPIGVCIGNLCAESGCDGAEDCNDPTRPMCLAGQCVASCGTLDDPECQVCEAMPTARTPTRACRTARAPTFSTWRMCLPPARPVRARGR